MENPLAERKVGLFVRLREAAVISCSMYSKALWSSWSSNERAIEQALAGLNQLRDRST